MSKFNISDLYPCGSYNLTKDGNKDMGCILYKNMSQSGVNNLRLKKLYSKGYINSNKNLTNTIETFINNKNNNINIIMIVLIILLIVILLNLI